MTVRELVHEAGLGLVLLTGELGLDNAIEGIHLSDLEDPTPWMTSGMVLVTTGATFAQAPEIGLNLLDRLRERDAVALGIGVGHYVDEVPEAMISRALDLRIPVFASPLEVPFRTIVKYVYNALASSDMHSLKRSLAMQTQLLDYLIEGRGVEDLIASLSSILAIPTVLFDAGGTVLAPTDGDAHAREVADRLWAEYTRAKGSVGPVGVLESAHHRLYYRKVQVYGAVERVLAASGPQASASELIDTSLSFVQRLLALDLLRSHEQLLARRRTRSLLLEDFLAERGTSGELLRRLQEQDIDLRLTWRLFFVGIDSWAKGESPGDEQGSFAFETAVLDATDECLGSSSLSFLSLVHDNTVIVLAVVDILPVGELRSVLAGLRGRLEALTGSSVAVGCSAPTAGLIRVRAAIDQGAEALQHARTVPGEGARLFEDLPRALRLLNGQDPAAMSALYERLIVPLAVHDERHHTSLLPTLRALCANRLSAHKTAEALSIHRNTLHKRLRRIESILGVDLDSMDDVLEFYVALRVGELHPESSSY
ncbi:MAG: PucR family transcriptional regulator ligand-binding domain-containing protein [Actinobacteria bacterium]|nr:PucR family transcriptional regulator ligand-binding domain-containing protein [Actinomycetota bacterium]